MKPRARAGFTMVEVLISLALLAVVLLPLAGATFRAATQARQATQAASIAAAVVSEGGRYGAMTFDELAGAAGCTTVNASPAAYTRCVSVTGSGQVRRVKVVIRPSDPSLRADSVILDRGKLRDNPLDTP